MGLTLVFWDVKHGSSVYIETPYNNRIIFDLGSGKWSNNDYGFSPLNYLKSKGITSLDQVIISHPDGDHIYDIKNLSQFSFDKFIFPKGITSVDINELINKLQDYNITTKEIYQEYLNYYFRYRDTLNPESEYFGAVVFHYYYPNPNNKTNRINNNSILVIIEYLGIKILLTGDNQEESWDWLLNNRDFVHRVKGIDVFMASHHGRKSGYYPELFKLFNPKVTIISDGKFTDTSITGTYDQVTTGDFVFKNGEISDLRKKCLTTRRNGCITVKIFKSSYSSNGSCLIYIEKG